MINSKYTIREHNEAIILKTLIDEKEISRATLAEISGLNKASVSSITKKLLDDKLIVETRVGNASNLGGRKPIMLTFNSKAALSLALDVAPHYIEGVLTYIDGEIVSEVSFHDLDITIENSLEQILRVINDLTSILPKTPHDIVGLCIGIHGLIDEDTILYTPNYQLPRNLKEQLIQQFNFPVYLENEGNLAALGEYTFTSRTDSLISLSIHTGIGAGIVENGLLRNGKHRKAGEIGHTILIPNGKICPCGNHGCLEQYASHGALYRELSASLGKNITSATVVAEYIKDNHIVKDALKKNAEYLGIAISSFSAVYDPDIVIINSSIYRQIPELLPLLQAQMTGHFSKDVKVQISSLNQNLTLLGGVSKTIQHFLNIQNLKL